MFFSLLILFLVEMICWTYIGWAYANHYREWIVFLLGILILDALLILNPLALTVGVIIFTPIAGIILGRYLGLRPTA